MDPLSLVWYSAAGVALLGMVLAMSMPIRRRVGLWVSAAGFTVAGVLGLASIGIFLLMAATGFAIAATHAPGSANPAPNGG